MPGHVGAKNSSKDGYCAGSGLEEVDKLDTDVDGAMRKKTRAGGRGTKAKKDTPAARFAR